jgi:hypothetical protein
MKLWQSFAAMVLMAAVAGHADAALAPASGGCERPRDAAEASSVVMTPDYAASADSEDDVLAQLRANAWITYQRTVAEGLAHSPDPREWVTASLIPDYEFVSATPQPRDNGALLRRALPAVGDDRFALWIAAVQTDDAGVRGTALARLRVLDAENAAVWLLELNAAAKAGDAARVDVALHRMADASRFDTYSAKLIGVATDAYRRFPASAELIATLDDDAPKRSLDQIAMASGLAISGMRGMPAFREVLAACRVGPADGRTLGRRDDCGASGRLMMLHSDTLLASHIGMALLRVSKTYGEEDLRAARIADWVVAQYTALVSTDDNEATSAQFAGFHDDWIASGSELTAMRLAVEHAKVAAAPPDDWVDTQSAFSAEHLRQDQSMLDRHKVAID